MRLSLIVAALVTALPCPAVAAESGKHLLRYKMKPGEVLRWEIDQRSSVRNTMEGTTQEAQTKTVSLKAWKVVDVMPDGEIEFINLVERVRMENKLPERATVVFDSTSDKDPPPGFEDAARAVGVPLSSIRLSPRGELVDRDIKLHQPAADPHELVAMLLPEKPVSVGDSWTQPQDIRVKLQDGGAKEVDAQRKYTLKSVENGVATIGVDFQVLSPTTPPIEGQLAHRMAKGVVRFDVDAGRVLSQRLDVDQRVIGFAGQASSMHLITRMQQRLQAAPASVASKP